MSRSMYISILLIVVTMLFCTFKTLFLGVMFGVAIVLFFISLVVNWNEYV